MIGDAMTFLENKFSLKSYLYFMRYMHANIKDNMQASKEFFISNFFYFNFFDFSIKFPNIGCPPGVKIHTYFTRRNYRV